MNMSEIKRVTLTTVSDVKKPTNSSETKPSKTVRLELNLFEPTAERFPEFNFNKLLHSEKKKLLKHTKTNGVSSDPFPNNDEDDVARIAREFEEKYGNAYSGKKPSNRGLECCDRGAGYDESDSFIDNTEAYDEIIPEEVETAGGGFYINSGALEFKKLSNFERPDDILRMPKPKKRALSSSSSSSESSSESSESSCVENDEENELPNSTKVKNGHSTKKFKPVSEEKEIVPVENATVTEPTKSITNELKKVEEDGGASSDSGKDVGKIMKTTTVKDMLRAKRDSLRKMELKTKDTSENNTDNDIEADAEDSEKESRSPYISSNTSENSSDQFNGGHNADDRTTVVLGDNETRYTTPVALPDNLSKDLLMNIVLLSELAKCSTTKTNFFDSNTTQILLQIEMEAKAAGNNSRNKVYAYLEQILPFTKQTIMSKARKLRSQHEESKVKKALIKLREGVNEVLPKLMSNYDAELIRFKELKALHNVPANNNNNNDKPDVVLPKMPKKRFIWNDNLRQLLCDVVEKQKNYFHITRPKTGTIEEFVTTFMKNKLFTLWPQGWMKFDDLQKEMDRRKKTLAKETTNMNLMKSSSGDNVKAVLNSNNGSVSVSNSHSRKQDSNTSNSNKHSKQQTTHNETDQKTISDTILSASSSSLTITPITSNSTNSNTNPNIANNVSKKNSNKVFNVDSGKFTADVVCSKLLDGTKTKNSSLSISLAKSSTSTNNNNNNNSSSNNNNSSSNRSEGRIEKKLSNSNNNSNSSTASNEQITNQTTPSKKSSDHSIISIISSPPPPLLPPSSIITSPSNSKLPLQLSANTEKSPHSSSASKSSSNHSLLNSKHTGNQSPIDITSPIKSSTSTAFNNNANDKIISQIINIDSIKHKLDLANSLAGNKAISSLSPSSTTSSTSSLGNSNKEYSLKVRSINNMNKSVDKAINKSGGSNQLIENPINLSHNDYISKSEQQQKPKLNINSNHMPNEIDDDSDSSDCVEIVEVFPAITKKKTNVPALPVNLKKLNSNNNNKMVSTSTVTPIPMSNPMSVLHQQSYQQKHLTDTVHQNKESHESGNKESELDISQIMKEIQELQQYGNSHKVDNDSAVNSKLLSNSTGYNNSNKKQLQDIPDNHTVIMPNLPLP